MQLCPAVPNAIELKKVPASSSGGIVSTGQQPVPAAFPIV